VSFNNSFKGADADPFLAESIISAEMQGVCALALLAYARVTKSKAFTMPQSSKDLLTNWRIEADQLAVFIGERCLETTGTMTPLENLYFDYQVWAGDSGINYKLTKQTFSKRLENLGYKKRSVERKVQFDDIKLEPIINDFS
jgi:phage/plasmid-associated DNA primase